MKLTPFKPTFKTKGASSRARERRRGRGLTNRRSRSSALVTLPPCFLGGHQLLQAQEAALLVAHRLQQLAQEVALFGSRQSASTGSSIFGAVTPPIASTGSSIFGGTSSAIPSTGSAILGFSVGATSSASTNQAQVSNPYNVGSAQASVNATGLATSTQSMPTSSSTSFGLARNPAFSSGSSSFGSSTSVAKPFSSTPTFGLNFTSSSEANSISSTSGPTNNVFRSSWQAPKTPSFASTFNSSSPSTRFLFGAPASSAATSSAPLFGSSTNTTSSSIFPFSSAAAATSSAGSVFAFGSTPSNNNNDQVGMKDSMAEDTVQASTPAVPVFGQQTMTPSTGFVFGSTTPSGANPFQFGSQQSLALPQNPSPFRASGSLDFNAGGSFSLGSGCVDKSQRKIVKLKGRLRRRKYNNSDRFLFGASASSAATSSAPLFGSSTNTTSSPNIFPFSSAAAATSSAGSVFAFGFTPSNNNNDQVGMEDSIAEDTVQASTPAVPVFDQQTMTPSAGFVFGSTTPSGANPFQFGSQQSLADKLHKLNVF